MPTNEQFMKVFSIFAKYEPDKSDAIDIKEDIIIGSSVPPENMSQEDIDTLEECDWWWNVKNWVHWK